MALFKIYAAKTEDVNQGWVWLVGCKYPQRSIVKLSANCTSKYVYCETRSIDKNFINDYNESEHTEKIDEPDSALVAAEWYRIRLGVEKGTKAEIKVTLANNCYGHIRACLAHPQLVVRLATWLGLLSVVLGLIGIIPLVERLIDLLIWLAT